MEKGKKDYQGINIPIALIYLLRFLNAIHPYLGMRLAVFFFSKPIKYKRPNRETPVFIQAKKFFFQSKSLNKRVNCYRWEGKGPKIILVHGWSSRATNFYKIIEKLIFLGYDVYAFDAPAHGESKGVTTNLLQFICVLEELIEEWGAIEALLGHSGGGFASAYVAAHNPKIKKLILISPFDKVSEIFETFFNMIALQKEAQRLMLDYFSQNTKKKVDDLSSSIFAQSIQASTLIIHDKSDKEVAFSDSVKIDQNLQYSLLWITEGLGHRRILREEKVVENIGAFLERNRLAF